MTTVKKQSFVPAWITTNIYGGAAGENVTFNLNHTQPVTKMSFEYKITDGSHFQIALLPDWSSFYGYFKMMADGPEGAYDGMTWETLEDGYIRVNFDIAALTRMTGTPAATISSSAPGGSPLPLRTFSMMSKDILGSMPI